MEVYLDNAATTKVDQAVCDTVMEMMQKDYGNPSSLHTKGFEAEKAVRAAAHTIARCLKVDDKEIVFTSGGTESNNMALIGAAMANQRRGKHIITSSIEHASVYNPLIFLEEQGFEVTYLPVDKRGVVRPETLKKALRPDTILVSIMCVNNEIGTIEPLDQLGKIIKSCNPETLFHVDAIQGFGKRKIYPRKLGIDLLSVSGHKIYGPKGVGFLYIRDKVKVHPLILGGGQQQDRRSGTENVPGIAGLAKAAELAYTDFEEKQERMYKLRDRLIAGLSSIDGVVIHGYLSRPEGVGEFEGPAPHIVSAGFDDIRAEVLLHALEERGIYVSSGSACSSNHSAISGTLKAIGVERKYLDATLRFSLSQNTTEEEMDYCIEQLQALVPVLRKYTRGGKR